MDNLVPHSTKQTDVTTQHSMLNPSDRQDILNYGSRGSAQCDSTPIDVLSQGML